MTFSKWLRLKTWDRLVKIKATIIECLQHVRFDANISFFGREEYSCFTMLYYFLLYSEVNQPYEYFFFLNLILIKLSPRAQTQISVFVIHPHCPDDLLQSHGFKRTTCTLRTPTPLSSAWTSPPPPDSYVQLPN